MQGRILLIDEQPDVLESIGTVLATAGFEVSTAATAEEALRRCRTTPFEVVVTDMRMPGMDGMELISRIKALDPSPEVVVLTGFASLENAIRVLRDGGAFDYLRKPLEDIEDLVVTVENAVEKRRLRLANAALVAELKDREQTLSRQNETLQRAQADYRKWYQRYFHLFDQAPIGYVSLDDQGLIMEANRVARELLGMAAGTERAQPGPVRFPDQLEEVSAREFERLCTGLQAAPPGACGQLKVLSRSNKTLILHLAWLEPDPEDGDDRQLQVALLDISREKRNEDALRDNEERFRTLIETIPQGVEEIDPDGTILFANPAHCTMLGYEPGSLNGKCILDFCCSEESRRELRDYLKYLVAEQPPPEIWVGKNVCCDGREIHIKTDWNYRRSATGEVTGFIAVVSDVTHEKAAGQALLESEKCYRDLVERAAEGICVVSREGVFETGNPRLCAILGYAEEELIGSNVCDRIDRIEWPEGLSCLEDLSPGTAFTGSCSARRKNGEPYYAEFSAQVLEDHRIQGIVRDVTERILAEQQLRASERRFKETVELLPNIICEIDADLTVTYVNRLGTTTLGYTPEQIAAGVNALSFLHPEDRERARQAMTRIGQGDRLPPGEFRLLRHDGTCLRMLINSSPILEQGELRGYRISLTDVTEFKQLLKRLQEGQNFEAIATLAGGIAHQFNNALSVIKGGTELLLMQRGRDPRDVELLEHIDHSTDRLAGLTAQLLAYARGGKYSAEVIGVNEVLDRCLRVVGHAIDPDIQLLCELAPNPHRVEVDLTQMQMVLSAILQNASEALSGKGSGEARIRISVATEPHLRNGKGPGEAKPGHYVQILIEDNGQGMSEEEKERIFDPFFTTKFQGRGLGMAAAYGIVKNHHGWIAVESEMKKGTTVHLYLPIIENAALGLEPAREEEQAPRRTILLVEDEPIQLTVARDMLEALGYRVLDALSGKAAIRVAETYSNCIDLVLLDLILPDIPAKAVKQGILQCRPQAKIVICSGYSLDGPARELLETGAIAFLQKPFSLEALRRILAEALPDEEPGPE